MPESNISGKASSSRASSPYSAAIASGRRGRFFPEIANRAAPYAAMRHEYARRAGRQLDRLQQARPVRVVGKREPLVDAAPAAIAAHLHPAAGECIGMAAEPLEPRAVGRRRRREHKRAGELLPVQAVVHGEGGRQRHALCSIDRVERLDRAMADDRPDFGIEMSEDSLRFAEAVGQHDARAALLGILAPPAIDFAINFVLRPPMVDRQAERRFGNERIAAKRREGRAGPVGLELVVAGGDPDLAAKLHPYLRGAQYVAGRMQRDFHAVPIDGFAIVRRLAQVNASPSRLRRMGKRCRAWQR